MVQKLEKKLTIFNISRTLNLINNKVGKLSKNGNKTNFLMNKQVKYFFFVFYEFVKFTRYI